MNYDPVVRRIKQEILDGTFGRPVRGRCVHAMRRGETYYSRNQWSGKIRIGTLPVLDSPFMNGCAHNFQLMTFLLGPDMDHALDVTAVEGELYRANPNLENYDIAALRCHMENDIPLLYLTAHPLAARDLGQSAEIEFEKGILSWGREREYRFLYRDRIQTIEFGKGSGSLSLNKLSEVIECCKTGKKPACLPMAGLPHLHAVELAQKLPIQPVNPQHIETLVCDGDRFLCVLNLETVLMDAYHAYALPQEIGMKL